MDEKDLYIEPQNINNAIKELIELLHFLTRYTRDIQLVHVSTSVLLILSIMIDGESDIIVTGEAYMKYVLKSSLYYDFISSKKRYGLLDEKTAFERVIECVQEQWKLFESRLSWYDQADLWRSYNPNLSNYMSQMYQPLLDCGEELFPQLLSEYLSILTRFEREQYCEGYIIAIKKVIQHILYLLEDITEESINCVYNEHADCPVCIEPLDSGEYVSKIPCGHCFHTFCIDQWYKKNQSCPVCRKHFNMNKVSTVPSNRIY